jgi:hypothetical protein
VVETESAQAVLNILTEHELQEAVGTVHTRRRGIFRGRWWPVGPKLLFDQMVPVSDIMDGSLYIRMGHGAQIQGYNHRDTGQEQKKNTFLKFSQTGELNMEACITGACF